jgi:hypothetical protein
MENFTPNALAASMQRERGYTTFPPGVYPPIGLATGFALYPRFYLHNATAQDYILIWKSINARLATDTWRIEVNIYDTAENAVSGFITIPNELNCSFKSEDQTVYLAAFVACHKDGEYWF